MKLYAETDIPSSVCYRIYKLNKLVVLGNYRVASPEKIPSQIYYNNKLETYFGHYVLFYILYRG